MLAYNHSKYIREAIESVLMQETNFTYQLIIGEDCSTDNTREICESYQLKHPNKIKLLPSESNQGMILNYVRTLKACTGKYIALCEGDDYWTDPLKLQKQIDSLEKNPDYGLVYTNYKSVDNKSTTTNEQEYPTTMPSGNILKEIINGGFPYTLTVCFRRDLIENNFDQTLKNHYRMADYPLWLHLSNNSKFKYLDFVSAAYRRHDSSVTSNSNSTQEQILFRESWCEILTNFISLNNIKEANILNITNNALFSKHKECFVFSAKVYDKVGAIKFWKKMKDAKLSISFKYYILYLLVSLGHTGFFFIKRYFSKKSI